MLKERTNEAGIGSSAFEGLKEIKDENQLRLEEEEATKKAAAR